VPAGGEVRGWLRRLAPPQWRRDVAPSSHEGAVRAAWVALLIGIARSCAISWLSDIGCLFLAENKVVQQAAAAALGISTPASAVVSESEQIPAALGERFVAKPLGPGQFDDTEGRAQVVFAKELTRGAPELGALGGAPFLLQELLEAERHLRVVTVADRFWVCALEAHDLPLDWRREDRAHDAFEPTEGYPEVGACALELARKLGVGYSSQDWIVARGGRYFLDLNPGGQWLFLPEPVSSEVTAAIATWLAG
jgi:glutathione synthase/RimK-type ligase-like ATP-grasp enzyme